MNVRWKIITVVGTAAILCAALTVAAAEPQSGQNQPAVKTPMETSRVSNLMGATVLYPQIQKLGQIKDILIDPQGGQATFAVVDAEIPGSGHAMLVVPYQALQVTNAAADNHPSVVLNVRSDRLRDAPQVPNNQWQLLQNRQFLEQARSFYGPRTYTAARPIENGGMPAGNASYPAAVPAYAPQPCVNPASPQSGLPADLEAFFEE